MRGLWWQVRSLCESWWPSDPLGGTSVNPSEPKDPLWKTSVSPDGPMVTCPKQGQALVSPMVTFEVYLQALWPSLCSPVRDICQASGLLGGTRRTLTTTKRMCRHSSLIPDTPLTLQLGWAQRQSRVDAGRAPAGRRAWTNRVPLCMEVTQGWARCVQVPTVAYGRRHVCVCVCAGLPGTLTSRSMWDESR